MLLIFFTCEFDGEEVRVGDVGRPEHQERPLVGHLPAQGHTAVQVEAAAVEAQKELGDHGLGRDAGDLEGRMRCNVTCICPRM